MTVHRKLLSILEFKNLARFIGTWISILAFIGIFSTLGLFSIRVNPECRILNPIFTFNMNKINRTDHQFGKKVGIIHKYDSLMYCLGTYGIPKGFDNGKSRLFLLPYEFNTGINGPVMPAEMDDFWYAVGFKDRGTFLSGVPTYNSKATRSDTEKMYGTELLLESNFGVEGRKDSLISPIRLNENPLMFLHNNPHSDFDKFILKFAYIDATSIYSILSISNYSQSTIDKINLRVNDVFGSGHLKLIGWTSTAEVQQIDTGSVNVHALINSLEPNTSVELVFEGKRVIRPKDILLSSPLIASLNKLLIKWIIVVVFLVLLVLYLIEDRIADWSGDTASVKPKIISQTGDNKNGPRVG
jgi:hypothetical protein